jgi:PKD repeat protein
MRAVQWCRVRVITAGLAVVGLGVVGCGKDSNGPDPDDNNAAPTADFTSSCAALTCAFTDLSNDIDGQVTTYAWEFGDGQKASTRSPSHTFGAGGDFSVKLTVTDDLSRQGSRTKMVTVAVPANGAPTADFSVSCSSLDCTFQDLSADADGIVVEWAWDFGDGANSAGQHPAAHHYDATARTLYRATLTVTDNAGLTSSKTTEFTVSPAATLQCEDAPGTGHFASCALVLEEDATVTVKLDQRSCDAHGNTFQMTAPAAETLFSDGCYAPALGASFDLSGGAVFTAGTRLEAQVISGAGNQVTAPALHVSGSYPTWTLAFDDGSVGGANEPDFDDLVITVTAHPVQ